MGDQEPGTSRCHDCEKKFTWQARERLFCPACERRCPHCDAYCRGGTHCRECGKHRALSIEEFAAEAPRLTEDQRTKLATLLRPAREHLTEQEQRKRR